MDGCKNFQESILTHFCSASDQWSAREVRFAQISAERFSISIGTISVRFTLPWGYHADSSNFFLFHGFVITWWSRGNFREIQSHEDNLGKKRSICQFTRNSLEFSKRKKQKTFSFQRFFQISKLWDIPPQPVVETKTGGKNSVDWGVGGYARIGGHQQKCWKWLGTPSFSWVKLKFLVFFV